MNNTELLKKLIDERFATKAKVKQIEASIDECRVALFYECYNLRPGEHFYVNCKYCCMPESVGSRIKVAHIKYDGFAAKSKFFIKDTDMISQ